MQFITDNGILAIRKSCLTGNAVWVYEGSTKGAVKNAYWKASNKEVERVRHWPERTAARRAAILAILSACTASLPPVSCMSTEQKAAVRELKKIANGDYPCYTGFYDHVMEERRRRREDGLIRQQMREREERRRLENEKNRNYDK